jgi:hypothetical protein
MNSFQYLTEPYINENSSKNLLLSTSDDEIKEVTFVPRFSVYSKKVNFGNESIPQRVKTPFNKTLHKPDLSLHSQISDASILDASNMTLVPKIDQATYNQQISRVETNLSQSLLVPPDAM